MRQSLKTGLIVLIVAAVAMVGVALAVDGGGELRLAAATVADEDGTPDGGGGFAAGAAERIRERLQPLVDETIITGDAADAVADHLADGIGPRGAMPRHGVHLQMGVGEVAEFFGMTPAELREAIVGGATLADLLEDAGATSEDFADALLGAVEERLDDAVGDGRITEEQKAEALERAEQRLDDLVENGFPPCLADRLAEEGMGGFPMPDGHHHRFPGGPGPHHHWEAPDAGTGFGV